MEVWGEEGSFPESDRLLFGLEGGSTVDGARELPTMVKSV